jgi:hypothetical protein
MVRFEAEMCKNCRVVCLLGRLELQHFSVDLVSSLRETMGWQDIPNSNSCALISERKSSHLCIILVSL